MTNRVLLKSGLGAVLCLLVSPCFARDLPFQERVAAQAAIERIYYSHQIGATKLFEQAVPHAVIEAKVRDTVRGSRALEAFWGTRITAASLQRELARIVRQTKFPERLREIEAALGYDPFLVREALARPVLVDRLTRNFFAFDERIHTTARERLERIRQDILAGVLSPLAPVPERNEIFLTSEDHAGPTDLASGAALPAADYRTARERLLRNQGQVVEERDAFTLDIVLEESPGGLRLARYRSPKREWSVWAAEALTAIDPEAPLGSDDAPGESMPQPPDPHCLGADTWNAGALDDGPVPRVWHTAIWTGTVMVVWGGIADVVLGTGERYDPVLDVWSAVSTAGAPTPRHRHTAVWSGTEMLVFGGNDGTTGALRSGGRYNPTTDVWAPMDLAGAPTARQQHTAVWTNTQMLVWGGFDGGATVLDTGARYNPATNLWTAMTLTDAPAARRSHTVVWTGSRMVVWGGDNASGMVFNTGGRYDPGANAWTPTSTTGAPSARTWHTAVWTGSRMIVWGGGDGNLSTNTGGRYDPSSDSWMATEVSGAPTARSSQSAVWAGTTMVVWAGDQGIPGGLGSGGRYDPSTNSWLPTSTVNAPIARTNTTMVWTGQRVIAWGGSTRAPGVTVNHPLNSGGRYDPTTDLWTPMASPPAPRRRHSAVWTGNEMFIWGGEFTEAMLDSGFRYDPLLDSWREMTRIGAPIPRADHAAVWTGSLMVVWGGLIEMGSKTATGGRYDPVSDSWTPTSMTSVPTQRHLCAAVWTGSRMLIWGGYRGFSSFCISNALGDGGQYDPGLDAWFPITSVDAPQGRFEMASVWTGTEMIVWGGIYEVDSGFPTFCRAEFLATGSRYNPLLDQWSEMTTDNAPAGRRAPSTVWTGSEAIVWGGVGGGLLLNSGGRYDPGQDLWTATTATGAPVARIYHVAVWTGQEMAVWGGTDIISPTYFNSGGRYKPQQDQWTATSLVGAPPGRMQASAVWTDDVMIVWGGSNTLVLNGGSRYALGQPDSDLDGIADICDRCPADPLNDDDLDSVCGTQDNCLTVFNPTQTDHDGDGVGTLCDVCPASVDPGQADGDADGAGDACDCQPGDGTDRRPGEATNLMVTLVVPATAALTWAPAVGADAYSIARASLSTLASDNMGPCLVDGVFSTSFQDAALPPAGDGYGYLVSGQSFDCGIGSLGFDSSETERTNGHPSACGGKAHTDVHVSSESTVFGTVSGTLAATQSSDDQSESITEVLSTGGSPANRFSRLEQRWTGVVAPGSRVEFHIEGFRTNSTDGDDFQFEYSTDGGTSFALIPLGSLPLSDDDTDRQALLPAGLSGSVLVRVVDTDRTAGHQTFDTVSVDELWFRSVP